jgi:AraC-like DNA-binding protein
MRTDIHIGVFDIFIFLGVFQGFFLSLFFIIKSQNDKKANLYQGLLLLFLSLTIFEGWLNNTGYIVKVLAITNFSEPLNFTFAPLLYWYFLKSLNPEGKSKEWIHFLPAIFWLFYMVFQFIQPVEMKYNSYIHTNRPDWNYLEVATSINEDPLKIRQFINPLTAIQLIIYIIAIIVVLTKKLRSVGQTLFGTDIELLIILRNTLIHFLLLITIFLGTKLYFGMHSDIGDYLIGAYISFMIYSTSYQVLSRSEFFDKPGSFFSFPVMKYEKSSLSEENKESILSKIRKEMEDNSYFKNNLASLPGLAKQINETSHHVSQVINEKLNKSFFELLASYRVEHAKKLIKNDKVSKITVEELSDIVGYNSKSSFNIAFKKYTLMTPSEYRKSLANQ